MKRCPDCGKYKPLADFPRNKRMRDGRHAYCKPCHNARGRETKERLYGGTRHYHLKHRYGISANQVDEMIRDQGGVCPIVGSRTLSTLITTMSRPVCAASCVSTATGGSANSAMILNGSSAPSSISSGQT